MRNQAVIGLSVFVFGILVAWQLGGKIVANDLKSIAFVALAFVGFAVAIKILRDWRLGFYSFLIWLLFEDLVRKYLGNNMAIYFGKDVLVGLTYIALFVDIRRRRAATFRPPFRLFLYLFLWLGMVQIFNSNSPSVLYGLMGAKIYFFYVPLMFVSYALIRNDEDLRKFLVVNAVLAGVISSLGIAQAILGQQFFESTDTRPGIKRFGSARQGDAAYESDSLASHGCLRQYGPVRILPNCCSYPRDGVGGLSFALYQAQPQARLCRIWAGVRRDSFLRLSWCDGLCRRERACSGCGISLGCSVAMATGS